MVFFSSQDYGCKFGVGDVVGAYLDMDNSPHEMFFTVNGAHQGVAYRITESELEGMALFPHVLTKNINYKVSALKKCVLSFYDLPLSSQEYVNNIHYNYTNIQLKPYIIYNQMYPLLFQLLYL